MSLPVFPARAMRHPDPDTAPLWLALVAGLCLAAAVTLMSGCKPATPLEIPDSPEITASLAVDGAAALVVARRDFKPAPLPPPPAPKPGDPCPNCGGTGKLGDTRVMNLCPPCKGTGKVQPQPKGA